MDRVGQGTSCERVHSIVDVVYTSDSTVPFTKLELGAEALEREDNVTYYIRYTFALSRVLTRS